MDLEYEYLPPTSSFPPLSFLSFLLHALVSEFELKLLLNIFVVFWSLTSDLLYAYRGLDLTFMYKCFTYDCSWNW